MDTDQCPCHGSLNGALACVFVLLQVMSDPVMTIDGNTYSRSSIAQWLSEHDTSPLTNELLLRDGRLDKSLRPNYALKQAIDEWRRDNVSLSSYNLLPSFHPSSPAPTNATNTVMHMEKYFRDAMGNGNSGDMPTTTSIPPGVHAEKSLREWTVENVFDLFYACGFETHGVVMGRVDGPTLYYLFTDPDSRYLLTAPAPEGLGLTPLQVSARLTCEMNRLMCNL